MVVSWELEKIVVVCDNRVVRYPYLFITFKKKSINSYSLPLTLEFTYLIDGRHVVEYSKTHSFSR